MRILVAEDERDLNSLLCASLTEEGYSVDGCFNGEDAFYYASNTAYDIIIMDVMMPELDGFGAVQKMRKNGITTPVLFLTAKSKTEDRIYGLESGGDYYLSKPFNMDELFAVIRALMRKYSNNKTNVFQVCDLVVDVASKKVTRAGKEITLTSKEFSLLEYMIRHKGMVLSREMIENNLWNYDYEGGTNVIDVYIGYLRRKIDNGFDTKLITTVWGMGWKFREE